MIDLNAVKQKARLIAVDAVHTTWSDYEAGEACEAAVNILVDALVSVRSHLITSRVDITPDAEDAYPLPEDFVAVDRIRDDCGRVYDYRTRIDRYETYCIEKNKIIMNPAVHAVSLSYFAKPEMVALEDGSVILDLPDYFRDPLARIMAHVLQNDYDAAEALALKTCLTTRVREVGRYPLPPLWGGYDMNV